MSTIDTTLPTDTETKRFDAASAANGAAAAVQAGDAKAAALFQKAYQKMVSLNRIDEQLQSMLGQRRTLQNELKDLQSQINSAFTKLLDESSQTPQRLLQEIAEHADA